MRNTLSVLFRGVLLTALVGACRLDQPASPDPAGSAELAQIVLVPAAATLAPGTSQQFTAYGRTVSGDSVATAVTFAATGGSVSSAGLYAAGQAAGTFLVIATSAMSNVADTSIVTVQTTPLAQLILVPAVVAVAAGGSVPFQVYGRTTGGDSVALDAAYVATGGAITAAGLYTAGSAPGTFQVIATQAGGTLADTAAVTITVSAPVCASNATMLCPGDDIQAKATAAGAGATLTLQPGVYRMQTVTPLANQTFVGQAGAIMSGATLLAGWVQNGPTWYVTGQTQKFADNVGTCRGAYPCQYQEDVYRDNVLLQRVLSLSSVTPGTFFFDYVAQRIYVGDDPTGHTLEGAGTEYAFQGSPQGVGTGVTISGLVIEKYANPAQYGAVGHSNMGANWTVRDCEIRYNHGGGIRGGSGVVVAHNRIHDNGQIGLIGYFARVDSNEIAGNNTAHFAEDWEAGGAKFVGTQNLIVRGNFVHGNHGRGLWTDSNNNGVTYDGNTVQDNEWDGIMHEISYSATITNNVVTGNGAFNPNGVEGAGIMIMSSGGSGVDVSHNTVAGNKNGIVLVQSDRGSGALGPYVVQNVHVHDNTVTLGPGAQNGADRYGGDTGLWTTNNNHFDANVYSLQTADAAPFLWLNNVRLDQAGWVAAGNDVAGTFNR